MIKIAHYADIQVKTRENDLAKSYEKNCLDIEKHIIQENVDVVVIAGDFFEFDEQTHLETKIMYNHFVRILKIKNVKEIVLMVGNHDIAKDRKELESSKGTNAIDTFFTLIDKFEISEYSGKLVYLKEQRQYISSNINGLAYIPYSLEDGSSAGSNIKSELIDKSYFNICVFHDILREYVDATKLPVKKSTYDRLMSVENFQSDLVLAGDIHKRWSITNLDGNIKFHYPGSTLERDHGEGTYIKIRKSINYDLADPKYLLIHIVDLENKSFVFTQKQLESYINHITIDINCTTLIDNVVDKIATCLDKVVYGIDQTFIKIKLSNVFIEQELDIFTKITEISKNKCGVTSVEFKYDKVVAKNTVSNNMLSAQLVQQVIDENGNTTDETIEINAENVVENFDNIILNEERLIGLFKLQLDTNKPALLKELGDEKLLEEVYENIVKLFAEQIQMTMGSIPNFNIKLLSIETNGFMQLDANRIDLDIPGLTRITGTNGVGKTQLYNMLRWLIDDLLFESLKTNQKVNNALLVFNDENINKNDVIVKLTAEVNNTPIYITRWVTRKWKNNISDEQKKSPDWKKHISDCTRGVKLEVYSPTKGETIKTGDEAEDLIKKWFKNTANTILILNQHKILTMLNLNSADLRQMVLDYIGVDYIYGLEKNLDMVKLEYSLQRPKRNKQDIRQDFIDKSKLKETGTTDLNNLELEHKELTTENNTLVTESEQHINELSKIGDVPELIKTNNENITSTQNLIDSFVLQEKQDLPKFEKVAPVKSNTEATQKIIDADKLVVESNLKSIDSTNILISDNYRDLNVLFDTNILKLNNALNDGFASLESAENVINSNLVTKISDLKTSLVKQLTEEKTIHNNIKVNHETKLSDANNKINNLLSKIDTLESEIENGCCNECKRLLDNFTEEHKKQKEQEISDNKLLIANLFLEIHGETVKVFNTPEYKLTKGINFDILQTKNEIENIQTFIDEINKSNYSYFTDVVIVNHKHLFINLPDITKYSLLLTESNTKLDYIKRKDVEYTTKTLGLELYGKIVDKVTEFNGYKTNIANREIQKLIDVNLDDIKYPQIKIIETHTKTVTKLTSDNATLNTSIETNTQTINNLNESYTKDLEIYQNEQTAHNTKLNNVIAANNLVDEHNKQLDVHKTTLNIYNVNKDNYEYQLPIYNELIRKRDAVKLLLKTQKELIDENRTKYNELNLSLNTIDTEINDLQTEYKDYLKYQKDTAIYNMYSKIIKKDFKDCVFGYYREFLNITLNLLLDEVNFKLMWLESGDLYYYEIKNGSEIYRPVQLVSGMQSCFLGLSLIYAIHTLNVKNNISHLFIDEISGQLNSGKELVNKDNAVDYQEKLLLLLSKFKAKNVFIIDHVIKNLFQTHTYEVQRGPKGSKYIDVN